MKEDKAENICVWFPDLICPIREMIDNRNRMNKAIKPAEDGMGLFSGMQNMMQQLPMDLTILPAYCNICHLRKKQLEG